MFGFCALGGWNSERMWESGMRMRWGAQRDPSKPTGEQVLRPLQEGPQEPAWRQHGEAQASGLLPSRRSSPPTFPRWGQWPKSGLTRGHFLQEAVCGLPAEFGSIPHIFIEHLVYAKHGAGFLAGNALSCLRGACGNFVFWGWGMFKAGLLEHVVLNTWFLLVASKFLGKKRVS